MIYTQHNSFLVAVSFVQVLGLGAEIKQHVGGKEMRSERHMGSTRNGDIGPGNTAAGVQLQS